MALLIFIKQKLYVYYMQRQLPQNENNTEKNVYSSTSHKHEDSIFGYQKVNRVQGYSFFSWNRTTDDEVILCCSLNYVITELLIVIVK